MWVVIEEMSDTHQQKVSDSFRRRGVTNYGCGRRKVFILLYKLLVCLCSVWLCSPDPDVNVFILLYNLLICFCVHQTQGVKVFILLYNLLICLCSVELCSPDSRCEGVYPALQLVDLLVFC